MVGNPIDSSAWLFQNKMLAAKKINNCGKKFEGVKYTELSISTKPEIIPDSR